MQVLWSGRLEEKPDEDAFLFQSSFAVDKRLALEDVRGSRAHAAMLGKQGILDAATAASLDQELARIEDALCAGEFFPDTAGFEDIHSYIEALLTERLGQAGKSLHAGRSRNDQVALDVRLYLKKAIPEAAEAIFSAIAILLDQGEKHTESIMPGYTHLQRAQPVTLAHHLIAWCAGLARDADRFACALKRLDECPLGAGAIAGSSLPLDRAETARLLGFRAPTLNAMDSVADRDFCLEISSCAAICMTHLSRFCEDAVLWASEEFKFLSFAEQWSTGSSLMPQKKNPDFAELIRGKAARTTGNLVTLLTLLKGLPYAYDKDLQEDKEALFDSLDTVCSCLRIFGAMMQSARFDTERMERACEGGFLEATDAAEYLVRKGLPFREAHEVVALVVRDCIAAHETRIGDRRIDALRERSPLFAPDIYEALTPAACVRARNLPGGCAPEETRRQIQALRARLEEARHALQRLKFPAL